MYCGGQRGHHPPAEGDSRADDNKYIEIYSGLEPGELVVVGSFEGLEDGMKVEADVEGDES
ncbi:hypothetical protein [Selenomonas sp. AB3002]|uniref:hypothetical protein n=1 Tax=Selenomonas sp. AB3002 TaxID=1392502 RepID=UPI0004967C30